MRFLLAAALLAGTPAVAAPFTLEFIGQQTFPVAPTVLGTTLGGLSGIDYDAAADEYIAISDDRSQINPARYYGLDLALTSTSFTGVTFNSVTTIQQPGGGAYPALSLDPEAIRRLPNGNYLFTSEGDANASINPFVREITSAGVAVRSLEVPAKYNRAGPADTTGIRQNLAFESLTVRGGQAFVATENALVQDGPAAAVGVSSPARILAIDLASGQAGAEFVYNVDPVVLPPNPANAFATNGLVELLAIGGGKFLAVERSFSVGAVGTVGNTGNTIKIFEIDIDGATDVRALDSLIGASYTAVSKTLLLDLTDLGIALDNIEGITFGETLEDGRRSLILVSDNNFSPTQFTQFLAFAVNDVAEPGALALLALGVAGLAARRRRAA